MYTNMPSPDQCRLVKISNPDRETVENIYSLIWDYFPEAQNPQRYASRSVTRYIKDYPAMKARIEKLRKENSELDSELAKVTMECKRLRAELDKIKSTFRNLVELTAV